MHSQHQLAPQRNSLDGYISPLALRVFSRAYHFVLPAAPSTLSFGHINRFRSGQRFEKYFGWVLALRGECIRRRQVSIVAFCLTAGVEQGHEGLMVLCVLYVSDGHGQRECTI